MMMSEEGEEYDGDDAPPALITSAPAPTYWIDNWYKPMEDHPVPTAPLRRRRLRRAKRSTTTTANSRRKRSTSGKSSSERGDDDSIGYSEADKGAQQVQLDDKHDYEKFFSFPSSLSSSLSSLFSLRWFSRRIRPSPVSMNFNTSGRRMGNSYRSIREKIMATFEMRKNRTANRHSKTNKNSDAYRNQNAQEDRISQSVMGEEATDSAAEGQVEPEKTRRWNAFLRRGKGKGYGVLRRSGTFLRGGVSNTITQAGTRGGEMHARVRRTTRDAMRRTQEMHHHVTHTVIPKTVSQLHELKDNTIRRKNSITAATDRGYRMARNDINSIIDAVVDAGSVGAQGIHDIARSFYTFGIELIQIKKRMMVATWQEWYYILIDSGRVVADHIMSTLASVVNAGQRSADVVVSFVQSVKRLGTNAGDNLLEVADAAEALPADLKDRVRRKKSARAKKHTRPDTETTTTNSTDEKVSDAERHAADTTSNDGKLHVENNYNESHDAAMNRAADRIHNEQYTDRQTVSVSATGTSLPPGGPEEGNSIGTTFLRRELKKIKTTMKVDGEVESSSPGNDPTDPNAVDNEEVEVPAKSEEIEGDCGHPQQTHSFALDSEQSLSTAFSALLPSRSSRIGSTFSSTAQLKTTQSNRVGTTFPARRHTTDSISMIPPLASSVMLPILVVVSVFGVSILAFASWNHNASTLKSLKTNQRPSLQ